MESRQHTTKQDPAIGNFDYWRIDVWGIYPSGAKKPRNHVESGTQLVVEKITKGFAYVKNAVVIDVRNGEVVQTLRPHRAWLDKAFRIQIERSTDDDSQ